MPSKVNERIAECFICAKDTKQVWTTKKNYADFTWDSYKCQGCGANYLVNPIKLLED